MSCMYPTEIKAIRTPVCKFLIGTDPSEIGKMEENIIETTDRISQLPEFIVHHILTYLNSPLHLVRMSVLSKNWLALTASFPILDFNISKFSTALYESKCPFNKDSGYIMDKFMKYVDYTTSRFCKQNVSARTLTLDTILHERSQVDIIHRCLESILKQGVQVFAMNIIGSPKYLPIYRLPNTLSSVSSLMLTSLKIRSCALPSSLMVDDVKFKSLKVLSLHKVRIVEEVIKYLTTNCPLLKEFNVKDCYGFKRFCVYGHQNLQKVRIYYNFGVERIDIEAPNLCYLLLMDWEGKRTPSMNFGLCKKLTTLSYYEYPSPQSNVLANFSSNFPFVENLFLKLANSCNNLKLSSPSLKTFVLHSRCDLEEIDINTPNLILFDYKGLPHIPNPSVRDSAQSKARMECCPTDDVDAVWFQKLRRFLDKKNGFKVLKLQLSTNFIDVEELRKICSPPYELEHVELELHSIKGLSVYKAVVDAVFWCCSPRSLTLNLDFFFFDLKKRRLVVKFMYDKLLQQEDRGHIQIVLSFSLNAKKYFSNLDSLLKALACVRPGQIITFTKEQAVQEAGYRNNQTYANVEVA